MFVSQLFAALWASAALLLPGAVGAQQLTPQQERMKSCNAEAKDKDLKGDERQNFMSRCLKGEQLTAQQEKMKSCNHTASERQLKGRRASRLHEPVPAQGRRR